MQVAVNDNAPATPSASLDESESDVSESTAEEGTAEEADTKA